MSARKTKGKDFIVYIDGIAVLYDATSKAQFTSKNADTTSRASQDANGTIWEESLPISIGVKFTGSGFLVDDSVSGGNNVYSIGRLYDAMATQKKVYVTFKSLDGLWLYGTDAYVMNITINADIKDVAKYDYEIMADGITVKVPVS